MTETTTTKAFPNDAGCWIDSHHGIHGIPMSIDMAVDHGMALDPDEQTALDAYKAGEDTFVDGEGNQHDVADWVLNQGGLADDAETWMTENVAPEGFYFSWEDGDFGMWSSEEPEDEEPDFEEEESNVNPYAGPGGLAEEFRQAERLLGTE